MPTHQISSQQKAHYDHKTSIFSHDYKQTHPFYSQHLRSIAHIVTGLTRRQDKILEIGCGDGLESNFIPRPHLFVSDISLFRNHSRHPAFILDLADPSQIRRCLKEHGRFDLLYEVNTLHHLPDLEQGLKAMKRLARTVVLFEPVIWNPQTFLLSMLNFKNETHYFQMTKTKLDRLLASHFSQVSHLTLHGQFHFFFALVPQPLAPYFSIFHQLTTLPKSNVYICR